jgi:L-asparaginase
MAAVLLANDECAAGFGAALDVVRGGGSALDAVEVGIRAVEAETGVDSVGRGGFPNMLGEVECDAAIMCGQTLSTGAVGALKGYLHAISVARAIMEKLPHVMLVGDGASRFAAEMEAREVDMLTPEKRAEYEKWIEDLVGPEGVAKLRGAPKVPRQPGEEHQPLTELMKHAVDAQNARGTSIFLARDNDGRLAGGTSSSGWMYKFPGRIGDSAIIGAGLYVDDRYGGAACTRTGEMTIRAGTARAVVAYMKKGATVSEACHEAIDDLEDLKGGYAGPVTIHALDREGNTYVITTNSEDGYLYWAQESEVRDAARAGRIDLEVKQAVVRKR